MCDFDLAVPFSGETNEIRANRRNATRIIVQGSLIDRAVLKFARDKVTRRAGRGSIIRIIRPIPYFPRDRSVERVTDGIGKVMMMPEQVPDIVDNNMFVTVRAKQMSKSARGKGRGINKSSEQRNRISPVFCR